MPSVSEASLEEAPHFVQSNRRAPQPLLRKELQDNANNIFEHLPLKNRRN
jgi:hypothetical protein